MITYSRKTSTYAKHNFNSFLPPYRKISLKWIIYLKVKSKTVKLHKESIGKPFCDLGIIKDLLDTTIKVKSIKENTDELDFIKIGSIFSSKENLKKIKKNAT